MIDIMMIYDNGACIINVNKCKCTSFPKFSHIQYKNFYEQSIEIGRGKNSKEKSRNGGRPLSNG